jgi:hypothetical protein
MGPQSAQMESSRRHDWKSAEAPVYRDAPGEVAGRGEARVRRVFPEESPGALPHPGPTGLC